MPSTDDSLHSENDFICSVAYHFPMGKVKFVYISCACSVITASISVAVIGFLRHPSRSVRIEEIKNFRDKARCAECQIQGDSISVGCEKCIFFRRNEDSSCILTSSRRGAISQSIKRRIGEEKWKTETIQSAHDREWDSIWTLAHLAKNVPRPTAHWTLEKTVGPGENIAVKNWIYETGCAYAHSENGIIHEEGGEMRIVRAGWYQIYIQMDFAGMTSNKTKAQSFKVIVSVEKNNTGHAYLLKLKGNFNCYSHTHSHSRAVARKQGMFHLSENERLRVSVTVPKSGHLATEQSQSYFGIHFVRGL